MRNGIYAVYMGNEYKAGAVEPDVFSLHSYNSNDVSKGFSLYKGTVYIKHVQRDELDEVCRIRTYAEYKNNKFEVIKEDGNRILLSGMVGDYRVFESLGMDMVEKGVYQKWVSKNDVTSMFEEKKPI